MDWHKMTLNHQIINTQTGEEIIKPFTSEEIAAYKEQQLKEVDEQASKAAARQAVLDKLGLSADEVAALLG